MKHRKVIPVKSSTSNAYNVDCVLGNMYISEVNKKFKVHPYQNNPQTLWLVKRLNNDGNFNMVTYKSIEEATQAIQKVCNEYLTQHVKFYVEA